MIKLELKDESKEEVIEKVVIFELRRHKQSAMLSKSNLLYLVTEDYLTTGRSEVFPIKIDGDKKEFTIRKNTIERLGFKLVIQGDSNVS